MTNLWEFILTTFIIFAFVAYIFILISIVSDIFRDHELNGGLKALWLLFLVVVPYLTAFIYLIARGNGMSKRQQEAGDRNRRAANDYIREVAGTGPASEIAQAKTLLDSGAISQEEYDKLKAKAMA